MAQPARDDYEIERGRVRAGLKRQAEFFRDLRGVRFGRIVWELVIHDGEIKKAKCSARDETDDE